MFNRITKTERYTTPHTIGGVTVEITKERDVPRPPADWDARLTSVGLAVALGLTGASVVWSTYAIGQLLHGGVGYIAAAIFDAAWLLCLLMEWLARWEPAKRGFAKRAGWGLLGATMFFIGWHGLDSGSLGMAAGGAAVSLFAKVMWLGMMRFVNRELSPDDLAWVRARRSEANALIVGAQINREVSRLGAQAQLMAAQARPAQPGGLSEPAAEPARLSVVPDAPVTSAATTPAVLPAPALQVAPVAASGQDDASAGQQAPPAVAAQAGLSELAGLSFGFGGSAQAQRAAKVAQVAQLIAGEPELTGAQVADRLGVSLASAKRYLSDARAAK